MENSLFFIGLILMIIVSIIIFIIKKPVCKCSISIDEKYAAIFVKNKLFLSGITTAQELKGGYSGNPTFIVDSDSKKYVIRFFPNKSKEYVQKEISCMKIGSDGGYGPYVYFADIKNAVVIMEYLDRKKIMPEQRASNKFYEMLASMLKKIHNGPKFKNIQNNFDIADMQIKDLKNRNNGNIPIEKIEKIIEILRKTLPHNKVIAPCHNDLHPNNLIFLGNEFKAIDYEFAGQGDPYFDIAVVSILHCFSKEYEDVLLKTYFEKIPTIQEEARVYLYKQVVFAMLALLFFTLVPDLSSYPDLEVSVYSSDVFKKMSENQDDFWHDLSESQPRLKFAKMLTNYVIANFDSQEFKNAVNLLS